VPIEAEATGSAVFSGDPMGDDSVMVRSVID
jgi:hypothetical protein